MVLSPEGEERPLQVVQEVPVYKLERPFPPVRDHREPRPVVRVEQPYVGELAPGPEEPVPPYHSTVPPPVREALVVP